MVMIYLILLDSACQIVTAAAGTRVLFTLLSIVLLAERLVSLGRSKDMFSAPNMHTTWPATASPSAPTSSAPVPSAQCICTNSTSCITSCWCICWFLAWVKDTSCCPIGTAPLAPSTSRFRLFCPRVGHGQGGVGEKTHHGYIRCAGGKYTISAYFKNRTQCWE